MLVGVVSDTHLPRFGRSLPPALLDGLRGVDLILHAGDLTELFVLDELAQIAPVEAVYGNVDSLSVLLALPAKRVIEVAGVRVGLVHGHGQGSTTLQRAQRAFSGTSVAAIVFGHSHAPYCQRLGEVLLFNPGSPTDKRREARPSFGVLRVEEKIEGAIHYL